MRQPTKGRTTKAKNLASKTRRASLEGSGWTVSQITNAPASARRRSSRPRSAKALARRIRRRPPNWALIFKSILLVAVLIVGGKFLLTSPKLAIRQVVIDGVQTINQQDLASTAAVPPRSNIFLFALRHRKEYCRKVAASSPVIQSASIGVDFPNTLRLHIVERQPFTVLHLQNGPSYLMDIHRVAFRIIAPNESDLPVVTVPASPNAIVLGQSLPEDTDARVIAGYNLIGLVTSRQIGQLSEYREVIVDPYSNVSLVLHNDLVIKLGQPDGLADRLALTETYLAADPGLPAKAQYLDFTSTSPAIMPKQAPLTALSGTAIPPQNFEPLKPESTQ